MTTLEAFERAVYAASERLARARYAEAEAFLLIKAGTRETITDGRAARQVVIDTKAELDRAETELFVAKCALQAYALRGKV